MTATCGEEVMVVVVGIVRGQRAITKSVCAEDQACSKQCRRHSQPLLPYLIVFTLFPEVVELNDLARGLGADELGYKWELLPHQAHGSLKTCNLNGGPEVQGGCFSNGRRQSPKGRASKDGPLSICHSSLRCRVVCVAEPRKILIKGHGRGCTGKGGGICLQGIHRFPTFCLYGVTSTG